MRTDPALCHHLEISKAAKVETVSVPELGIEQLVLRVRVYCKQCKEAFIPKTMSSGFSTEEIGVVGDELFVPLEYPQVEEADESDMELLTQRGTDKEARPSKEQLH